MDRGRRELLFAAAIAAPVAALAAKPGDPVTPTPIANWKTITPQQFGAVGDGKTHPLSSVYASLAAAQAVYPFATSLTDEIDACAFQAAMDWFLSQNPATQAGQNWSNGALYVPTGVYLINREIVSYVFNLRIYGDKAGLPEFANNATKLVWTGPTGTIDAPKYILKNYTMLPATRQPPPGVLPQPRGVKFEISGIGFDALSSINAQMPGYVSAIFLGRGGFTKITDCTFGAVYDGIALGGEQLFVTIARNNFYGVYRDCFTQFQVNGDFTTCLWIKNNEFGFYGRYAILVTSRAIQAKHVIEENDFEGQTASSFYVQNKAHFFQGIDADVCLMGFAGVFNNNRFETDTYRHNLHIVSDAFSTIAYNNFSGVPDGAAVALSCAGPANQTGALTAYMAANGYSDITAQRGYTFDNTTGGNGELSFYSNFIPGNFAYRYGAAAFDVATGFSVAMQSQTAVFDVPVIDGTTTANFEQRAELKAIYQLPFVTMSARRGLLYHCVELVQATHNIGLGLQSANDYGGGEGVIAIGRTFTPPTGNPEHSTLLWMDASDEKLKIRSPNGTITVLN